jgi:hypothetical protein
MALFVTHWDNVLLDPIVVGNFVLPDGTTRDQLNSRRDQLVSFAATIQGRINDREITRGTIENSKDTLLGRLNEFNRKVRGFLADSPYAKALPDVPTPNAGEAKTLAPLDDMSSLWAKINVSAIPSFVPPLLLIDGYDVTMFDSELVLLKSAYDTYQQHVQQLKLEREQRNDVQDLAYAAMRDYRAAVQGTFAPDHALVASLPRLKPEPGSTPSAVTASGVFDVSANAARITWTASSDANLDHYEVRMTPGPTYDTDADTIIGNLATATLELLTLDGIPNPGDTASYKVYVVLTTGNESGSNTVTINRP